jgi:hypothetical protein
VLVVAPSTLGPQKLGKTTHRLFTTRVIEVKKTGRYILRVSESDLGLVPCDPIADEPAAVRAQSRQQELAEGGLGWLHGGTISADTLDAGRYRLLVGVDGEGPQTVVLRAEARMDLQRFALLE